MTHEHKHILDQLTDLLETRLPAQGADPQQSYVAQLYRKWPNAFLKKIGEEATEVVLAAKDGNRQEIIAEMADLWFHSLVVLSYYHVRPDEVFAELAKRQGISGLKEKASRSDDV